MPDDLLGEGCVVKIVLTIVSIIAVLIMLPVYSRWTRGISIIDKTPQAYAIRAYMNDIEDQGYNVTTLSWGEMYNDNRDEYIAAFRVSESNTDKDWIYTWVITIPAMYIINQDDETIREYAHEVVVTPKTEPARIVLDQLPNFYPDWYNPDDESSTSAQ